MPGDDVSAPRAKAAQPQIAGLGALLASEAENALYGAPGPARSVLPALNVRMAAVRVILAPARSIVDPASDLGKGLAALAAMLD